MIRICLVDDQTLVRQGIRSLLALAEGIEVIAEAGDGKQAVELIPQVKPDVVLMDMRMPVMSGLEALQALARIDALPPTIILTTFDDDQLVLAGLKAGAKGYLLKDVSLEQLVGAIQAVAAGGSLVQPAVTQRLLSGLEHMRNEFVSLDRPDITGMRMSIRTTSGFTCGTSSSACLPSPASATTSMPSASASSERMPWRTRV